MQYLGEGYGSFSAKKQQYLAIPQLITTHP